MSRLEDFIRYNEGRRATGKTWAMVCGVQNSPGVKAVMAYHKQGKLVGLPDDKFITIDGIPEKMMSSDHGFLIDHHALDILFREHEQEWHRKMELIAHPALQVVTHRGRNWYVEQIEDLQYIEPGMIKVIIAGFGNGKN